jgi:hypothetical protein
MVVMDARVMEQAPQVIESWHLERVFESSREASFEEYSQWTVGHLAAEEHDAMIDQVTLPPDAFFLAGIRKDGYREYRTAAELGSWITQREASRDLHGPLAVRD